jgi:hypothetical protein
MKTIWQEVIALGEVQRKTYTPAGYRRSYDDEYLATRTDKYTLTVKAVYDRKQQILGIVAEVDVHHTNAEYLDSVDSVTDSRVLEFRTTRETAIRSVLAHIAEWVTQALAVIPPSDTRSDEQVKADWYASRETQ